MKQIPGIFKDKKEFALALFWVMWLLAFSACLVVALVLALTGA